MSSDTATAETPPEPRRRSHVLGWSALLLATAVLYRAPLLERAEFEAWDQARVYVPLQVSNARQRANGEIPLWFRHGFLGYPMQAETECSGVYPPALVFNLVDDPGTAWSLFLLLHQLVAIGGMFALLGVLGCGVAGRVVAAMVFVLGGSFVGELPQATLVTTIAWLPLIAALLIRACRRCRFGPAIWAGVVLAIQVSGGHPQVVFYTLLLLGLVVLCEFRRPDGDLSRTRQFWFAVRAGLLVLVVGLGLAAPQVLYCFESMQFLQRWDGLSYDQQMDGSLPPHFLAQLLLPGVTGGDHRLQILFVDLRIYVGLLTLPLVVVGWRRGPRAGRVFRWAVVLALVFALGRYSGVFLLLGELPGFRSIHVPARFLAIASLSIAVLAGLGLDHLERHLVRSRRTFVRSGVSLGVVAAVLLALAATTHLVPGSLSLETFFGWGNSDKVFRDDWKLVSAEAKTAGLVRAGLVAAVLAGVAAALFLSLARTPRRRLLVVGIIAVLGVDLLVAADRLNDYAPRGFYSQVPPTVAFFRGPLPARYRPPVELMPSDFEGQEDLWRVASLTYFYPFDSKQRSLALLPDNSAGLFDLDSLSANPGVRPDWFVRTSNALKPDLKMHALLNVRLLVHNRELPGMALFLVPREQNRLGEYFVYRVSGYLPRVTICHDPLVISNDLAALATIHSPRFILDNSVVLDRSPTYSQWGEELPESASNKVRIRTYGPQEVVIDVTLPRPAIVVLADLYYPGWEATDNGRPVRILRANTICRAVALGVGQHTLRFVYRPQGFTRGLWIAAATLLVLLVVTAVRYLPLFRIKSA